MLETLLAKHCGPALAGIKPGNLVTCIKNEIPNLKSDILRLNFELNRKDIYIEAICECDRSILLLVYRRKLLGEYLNSSEIFTLLKKCGYDKCKSIEDYIERLKTRLDDSEFPHEIGAFLGYPAHDIYGFVHHRDEGCLLVGEWRVYKDADKAAELFRRYKCCRCAILKRLAQGKTLAQIFCAA